MHPGPGIVEFGRGRDPVCSGGSLEVTDSDNLSIPPQMGFVVTVPVLGAHSLGDGG